MPTIPRTGSGFYEWQKTFAAYLEAHGPAMNIPAEGVDKLKAKRTVFEDAYAKAEEPNHGSLDTAAKNDAREDYEHTIRAFIKGYLYNPAVSDNDRRNMGIPDHKTPSHSQTPASYPEAETDSSTIRRLIIHYRDNGGKSRAKPQGVHGAELRWMISDAPISDAEALLHSEFDTASPFTLNFQGHERGKTVYFCLRWENTVGEKGPWGEIYSAIVP
jgi:hypothetical protein